MAKVRAHLFITGRVQGVFFRASTQEEAKRHGLTGWAKNLYDGRVEALFEGKEEDVERVVLWCYQGPAYSSVTRVEVKEEHFTGEFDSFLITY